MDPALPIIMLVIGASGVACIAWAVVSGMRHKPEPTVPVAVKRTYVAPSNEEDVDRLVAALQRTSHDDARRYRTSDIDQN